MKRPPTPKLAARRREVSNLALKGWTQAAIARHLQIPQGTVSRDLAAMRESWREFPVYDFDKVRLEQLQKIDLVEAEAWAAWQRSQQQRHSAALTRGKSGEQTRTSLQDQYGDPRYLREIARCVAQRHQMIGVQPPEAPPEKVKIEIPECALTDSFRYYLALRSWFGDPPYNELGGLRAEHYAALAAEHERDPFLHDLLRKQWEQENPSAPGDADQATAGQENEQASPQDD
jgi:hypothetical protein